VPEVRYDAAQADSRYAIKEGHTGSCIQTSQNSYSTRFVNKGKKRKGRGCQEPRPAERVANCVGLLLFRGEPKLLHHAQIIVAVPILDCLAPFDAAYADAFDLYLPVSGGPNSSISPW
jgi:hypothetical protein